MTLDELQRLVGRAIENLFIRDSSLFTHDASEWALAHRLAVYLEHEIPGWNVDCEYNRQGAGQDPKSNADGDRVRPDICVHHRGSCDLFNNLLVIELKKLPATADLNKAREYTRRPRGRRKFQYQYGLAIVLDPVRLTWYESERSHN